MKTVYEILLVITILGLVGGSFSTTTIISHPVKSSLITEIFLNNEIEQERDKKETEQGSDIVEDYNLQYTLRFSKEDLNFDTLLGYDLVTMKECSYLSEIGKPKMPMKNIKIAIPSDIKVTRVRILSIREEPIQGTYTIFPTQRPLPVGETYDQILSVRPNKVTYTSPFPYPLRLVSLGEQNDLAGQSMIQITVFPLHYLPLQKKLTLVQSISIVIEGVEGYVCKDFLPQTISENGRMMYEQMIKGMVINPETIELCNAPNPQPMGVPAGDYDYVIITQESWVNAFQPLATWKTQKGVPATIVTTNWIYNSGGYSGTNVQKIKAFVQDAYTTWGTIYVLLGGDIDVVPCYYRTFSSVDPDSVPNDAYYADFDSDWICEVNVGRASVNGTGNSTGRIGNFIHKIITYETNPPLTNYAMNAGFFGFDLDSSTHGYLCKINIKNAYIPTGWTMTTVYDNQTGNHKTNVITALNAGQNLVNHADHSNNDCMGTGYVNHDWLIYNSDMDALTNGNKQTILYSMGCDPAAYDVTNCIAEHFVRNSNGGGIAFIGNSRYGWYNYATYDTLSMGFDVHFFKSLFQENLYHLGAAFSDHKNDGYQENPGDNYYKYIFTELTLLGDPELPVWTQNPATFVVSHPLVLPLGSSSFTVHVQTTGGSNVQNAYVCLWKGTEVYQNGYTNSAGNATFTVSPVTVGIMNVTVTKQNYIPSRSTVQTTNSNIPPNQPSSPVPTNNTSNVSLTSDCSWTGGDLNTGDIVTYDVYFGTSSTPPRVVNNQSGTTYDPGTLNFITTYYWKIIAWDNHGASTRGPLWRFTTKANSPPVFGTASPTNGSTDNLLNFIWSIPITDSEGNTFSWSIQCSNGQVNSGTGASNGTKSLTLSGLSYSKSYKVWVNATDPGGSGIYTRKWYTFTTLANQPPEFGTPTPANGSINNPLNLTWSIPITDSEGNTFSWSIQCNNGQVNSGTGASNGTKSLTLSGLLYSKSYKVWVNATDSSGSGTYTRHWYTFNTGEDVTPPVTTIVFNGTMGNNGWYISPVIFILTATDTQSGVDDIFYKIDADVWSEYSLPVEMSEDGNHEISYYAADKTGNIEPTKTANISIDQTPPEITLSKQQINVLEITFTAQVSDETSGIDRVEFSLDGVIQYYDTESPYEWTWTGLGDHTVTATAYDLAGNSQSQSMSTPVEQIQTINFLQLQMIKQSMILSLYKQLQT
jgi:hypothetical protein